MSPNLPDSRNPTRYDEPSATSGSGEPDREDLLRALALAEKKLEIVGSVTRHDALNQLTAIMGYNELLGTMVQDKEQQNFLEIERRSSEKMRRIFAYSKVYQSIGLEPPVWQNFGMLIRFARDEVDTGNVAIRSDVDACSVFAAPLFVKVLVYLFDNAARHGKSTTGIQIRLRQNGQDAVLCIEDDGVGVHDGDKEKIFDKGFGKYTGWGLFVARDILAANGMTIKETGTAGAGACFEIRIPAERIRIGTGPVRT
ncbi:MAG: HAMP domain-containing sensor histidine kinase [Methanoregula sp.]|nr:MAG: HAMP domain-containing sensor histidine kinase [Methanoregula sp.]